MATNDQAVKTAERRKTQYRDIVTGVFGLVLALGAFSLTDLPVRTPGDVWTALGLFTPAFFFVLTIWQLTADLFDRYPPEEKVFYAAVTLILFLTTLAPVSSTCSLTTSLRCNASAHCSSRSRWRPSSP